MHLPLTGQTTNLLDAAALALLNLIPLPNQPGTTHNFHYQTTTGVNTDDINVRVIHNFGEPAARPGRGRAPGGGGRGHVVTMSILRPLAFSLFGRCSFSTPSVNSARIFSVSISRGSVKVRVKVP